MDQPHNEVVLNVAPGGRVCCAAPRTTAERSQMFATIVSVSLLLRCDLVLARHWFPGVHLFVQASHHLHRPGRTPIQGLAQAWERLEPDVVNWLDCAVDTDPLAVRLPTAFGDCTVARDCADLRFDEVAFTFDVQWPLPTALRA